MGAEVALVGGDASVVVSTTSEQGRYEFRTSGRLERHSVITIRAWSGVVLCGSITHRVWSVCAGIVELEDIHLRAAEELTVRVTNGEVPQGQARVHIVDRDPLWRPARSTRPRNIGAPIPAGITGLDGTLRVSWPRSDLVVIAEGPDGDLGKAHFRFPDEGSECLIQLRPPRRITVRVIESKTHLPVAGCAVLLLDEAGALSSLASQPARTDEAGTATLVTFGDERGLRVRVCHDDWMWPATPDEGPLRLQDHDGELLVVLPARVRIRIPAEGSGAPLPAGSAAEVVPYFGGYATGTSMHTARVAVVESDAVVLTMIRAAHEFVLIRLADGRSAFAELRPDVSGALVSVPSTLRFGPPRSLQVVVTGRPSGKPAAHVGVRVVRIGDETVPLTETLITDDSGRATFFGLPDEPVGVRLGVNHDVVERARLGTFAPITTVDLSAANATCRVEVDDEVEVRLMVSVEGHRALPPGLRVGVMATPEGTEWVQPRTLVVEEAGALLSFTMRPLLPRSDASPRSGIYVRLSAPELAELVVRVPPPAPSDTLDLSVNMIHAGRLRAVVPSAIDPVLERRMGAEESWRVAGSGPSPSSERSPGLLFDSLEPGVYRLRDSARGWICPSVEVFPKRESYLEWDTLAPGWAEGNVELPAGVDPAGLAVRVEGAGSAPWRVSTNVFGTAFRVRVPGNQEVRLIPEHPDCEPDGRSGEASVSQPRSGIVLRMRRRR